MLHPSRRAGADPRCLFGGAWGGAEGLGRGGAVAVSAAAALLLLGDGRFPAGGHVHSGGVESAVADGRVRDVSSLEAFVAGRLRTAGLVDAGLALATWYAVGAAASPVDAVDALRALDAEVSARLAAAPLRAASRRTGRQLARVAGRCWPSPLLAAVAEACPDGAHLPVAFGVVGLAAGLDAAAVAQLVLHHALTTPAQAAVRLLGLDPFAVAALTARLGEVAEAVAAEACLLATTTTLAELPALGGPVVDIAAVEHQGWDLRLFAT